MPGPSAFSLLGKSRSISPGPTGYSNPMGFNRFQILSSDPLMLGRWLESSHILCSTLNSIMFSYLRAALIFVSPPCVLYFIVASPIRLELSASEVVTNRRPCSPAMSLWVLPSLWLELLSRLSTRICVA